MRKVVGVVGLGGATVLGILGVVFLVATDFGNSMGGHLSGERLARAERSPNFVDGAFRNPIDTPTGAPGRELDMLTRAITLDTVRTPPSPMPIVKRTRADFTEPPAAGLEAVWIGHSTTVVDIEGSRVMTDPMLSNRASPVSWAGPARYHELPLPMGELPDVDVVVVSHDHYDHLDRLTIQALARNGATFVLPLGMGAHLDAWNVPASQVIELDWWEAHTVGTLTVHCVPARHYSGRGPFDQNEALWAGWVLEGPTQSVFYSGDTGAGPHFEEIGRRLGPFDLAIVKVGEYDETWPFIHLDPAEAVAAVQAVGGRAFLPVHWGTFNLAYHDWDAPIREAVRHAQAAGVAIATPRPGERVVVGEPLPTEPWWESVR